MSASRGPRAAKTEKAAQAAAEPDRPAEGEAAQPRRRTYLPAAERKRRIILAAQEVFARSNLQGARTRDIAKAAEVNQATLFEHFDSKEALFFAAVVNPLLDAMRGMQDRAKAYEEAKTDAEMLDLARDSAARHIESLIEVFPLLTASLFSDAELGRKLYNEQIAPLMKERGAILQGILRDELDPEFTGLALFGILFAVAMDQTFKGRTMETAELARQVTQLSALGFLKHRDQD